LLVADCGLDNTFKIYDLRFRIKDVKCEKNLIARFARFKRLKNQAIRQSVD